jgi:toxin ParE1/3/4
MSRPNSDYELSARARIDYEEILLYSHLTWGERQMRRFEAKLERSLQLLARYPLSAPSRPDLGPGLRARIISPYIAFYRVEDGVVVIARILHERRDARVQDI